MCQLEFMLSYYEKNNAQFSFSKRNLPYLAKVFTFYTKYLKLNLKMLSI